MTNAICVSSRCARPSLSVSSIISRFKRELCFWSSIAAVLDLTGDPGVQARRDSRHPRGAKGTHSVGTPIASAHGIPLPQARQPRPDSARQPLEVGRIHLAARRPRHPELARPCIRADPAWPVVSNWRATVVRIQPSRTGVYRCDVVVNTIRQPFGKGNHDRNR